MKFVYEYPEQFNAPFITDKFNNYDKFSQFCLGGKNPLAHYLDGKLKLTQEGVRELHRIKSERLQRTFNVILLIATICIAVSSVIQIMRI